MTTRASRHPVCVVHMLNLKFSTRERACDNMKVKSQIDKIMQELIRCWAT